MLYTNKRILFISEKEENSAICNMDEPGISYRRTHFAWFYLYEISEIVQFIETENRDYQKLLGGNRELWFKGSKVSVTLDKHNLEFCCTT